MCKISIIVPVYKAESYLHKCIQCLLKQTFTDYEVLLVNDGSPDRSGEICEDYATQDIRVRVFHKENGGVSSARQCGLDNAIGEYIIHVDPDDWIETTMLEKLYKKAKDTDADMVICDFYENFPNKQVYRKQQPTSLSSEIVLIELFKHLHGSCCNKLIKREIFSKYTVEFDLELCFCEDLYINACLLKHPLKIAYLPSAFYHYTHYINSNSLIRSYSLSMYRHDLYLYNKFCTLLKGTSAYFYAKNTMAFSMISRAFVSKLFNGAEFKRMFYMYRTSIWHNRNHCSRIKLVLIYISCIGYYDYAAKIHTMLKKIKKLWRPVKK